MKKNLFYIVIAIAVGIFTACGTDSKENPAPASGPYSFFNATTPVEIKKPSEVNGTVVGTDFNVSVQLLKNGFVEVGQSIEMKPFDFKYGSVKLTIVETDDNGLAQFDYVAPEGDDYNDVKGQDFTITAVFKDPEESTNTTTSSTASPKVLISQEFVLQFR